MGTWPSLGEIIRRQRELHEYSLRQLAEMTGISNPYLSQIELGHRTPSEEVIRAIAESLETSADALLEQAGVTPAGEAPAVVKALEEDAGLTPRQRRMLIDAYRAFVAVGDSSKGGDRGRGLAS